MSPNTTADFVRDSASKRNEHRFKAQLTPAMGSIVNRNFVCIALFCSLSIGCSGFRKKPSVYDPLATMDGIYDDNKSLIDSVHPDAIYASAKDAVGQGKDQQLAQQLFNEAEAKFKEAEADETESRKRKFKDAAKLYAKVANRATKSKLQEDAMFLVGESQFFAELYPQAIESFSKLVKHYQNTQHFPVVDARRFSIAKYWIEHYKKDPDWVVTPNFTSKRRPTFDKLGHAFRVLDQIRIDNPTGDLADDATMLAGVTNFEHERYMQADEMFSDLRRTFLSSEHQFNGHLLGLKAKMMLYQGADYDGTALQEAEALVKQIARQFPVESREHEEFLTNAYRDIRMNSALQDWNQAKYYDKRKEYGAARRYYGLVAQNYPDTSLAEDATARLAKIGGLTRPSAAASRVALESVPDNERHETADRSQSSRERFAVITFARKFPILLLAVTVFAVNVLSSGCATYQIGQNTLYRGDIRTIHISTFQSETFRRGLGEWLTEAVVKEVQQRTPYQIVDASEADSFITGRIVEVSKRTLAENINDEPRNIALEMRVETAWRDRQGNLLGNPFVSNVPPSFLENILSDSLVPEAGQSIVTSEQRVIEQLAEQIVSQLELPW